MENKIKISQLPKSETLEGFSALGVSADNATVKVDMSFVQQAADRATNAAVGVEAAIADTQAATNAANAVTTLAETAISQATTATAAANTAKDIANAATTNANSAATRADQKAEHADANATSAAAAATRATEAAGSANTATSTALEVANNPTKVGDDGYVYKYDFESKTYIKTDILVKGKTAYQSASDGGFKGTESEFNTSLSSIGNIENTLLNILGV